VRRIRQASVSELTEVSGIGPSTARAVLAALALAENNLGLAENNLTLAEHDSGSAQPVGAEDNNGVAR